jgi:gamma-glutamyltranspeptidase/glutathione hydrolase
VQQILGILEQFDLAAHKRDQAAAIHLITEASSLAFADRNYYLADPDFVDVPVPRLLDRDYLRQRAQLIDPKRALGVAEPGEFLPAAAIDYAPSKQSELTSTSHFSIVDRDGHAVSMTTSVQGAFGSQLMVGGFLLNNQLTDFSEEPVIDGRPVANRAEAGKRPLSSMTPTIILDPQGRLHMLIGSPGGTRIINYVAQTIVAVLDWDMNIQDAVAAPHFLSRGGPIEIEEGTGLDQYADELEGLGHRVTPRNLNSGLHGITVDYDGAGTTLAGGVDPRREGLALGD